MELNVVPSFILTPNGLKNLLRYILLAAAPRASIFEATWKGRKITILFYKKKWNIYETFFKVKKERTDKERNI